MQFISPYTLLFSVLSPTASICLHKILLFNVKKNLPSWNNFYENRKAKADVTSKDYVKNTFMLKNDISRNKKENC